MKKIETPNLSTAICKKCFCGFCKTCQCRMSCTYKSEIIIMSPNEKIKSLIDELYGSDEKE